MGRGAAPRPTVVRDGAVGGIVGAGREWGGRRVRRDPSRLVSGAGSPAPSRQSVRSPDAFLRQPRHLAPEFLDLVLRVGGARSSESAARTWDISRAALWASWAFRLIRWIRSREDPGLEQDLVGVLDPRERDRPAPTGSPRRVCGTCDPLDEHGGGLALERLQEEPEGGRGLVHVLPASLRCAGSSPELDRLLLAVPDDRSRSTGDVRLRDLRARRKSSAESGPALTIALGLPRSSGRRRWVDPELLRVERSTSPRDRRSRTGTHCV